ncbi:zinc finger and BTB domain-containing 21 isoform X1 [Pelobates cultripes]|uniref:Zinc finger and BTB domain-containing 21 isoform X1 n=1 Tax=Pelobates cultripes TaxID=61616 RepID=A0AAD1VJD2_PELCU|nr:zinc finger and BTB domain-containing 21 isoform X1 [Pelobates cultripes]
MEGGLLHYINPAHAISLLSALNEERMKGQLCDVILIVGDQKFRAHKNVLAASSEYFHSLFTDKGNESQNVFQLDFCEADAFDNVLNYIYSSSLFAEKGSLAAVQELGYSLGITFLTNILSKTPQAPFSQCPNKKTAFQEEDENGSQQRSVIVCQSRSESQSRDTGHGQPDKSQSCKPPSSTQGKAGTSKQHSRPADPMNSLLLSERSWRGLPNVSSNQSSRGWLKRNVNLPQKTESEDSGEDQPTSSGPFTRGSSDMLKKKVVPGPSSVCSTESPYSLQRSEKETVQKKERNLLYYSKLGLVVPSAESATQSIDRSGPLVKSLLRRSLSMDSQVPTYSQNVGLQPLQGAHPVKDSLKEEASTQRASIKGEADLLEIAQENAARIKSFRFSRSASLEAAFEKDVHIKTEPRSPASEPSEIIRVTVGDSSQVKNKDLNAKSVASPNLSRPQAKRKSHPERRTLPSRRVKMKQSSSPEYNANFEGPTHPYEDFSDSDDSKEVSSETQEIRQNRKFKCKHCLKIFRSTAGLHRHVNMYHNPEKPYACDICNKRFHTNFKVWTHCQTQHGIIKNPSPSSSAHGVLDEKFQRKLIDIVREREIKKALIFKLRRGKSGYQGSSSSQAQALKRSLRSRAKASFICNYCGKSYRFLSQFKQHCKMHPGDKLMYGNKALRSKEPTPPKSPVESKDVFHCRLCNTKLSSFVEQGNHERMCRNATLCPYCSLRFTTPELKTEHETRCEYKKLTCLECMRTFKSSFSIWRHQVEVHNQNTMAPTENLSLPLIDRNGERNSSQRRQSLPESSKMNNFLASKEDGIYSDSSDHMNFDSEDSNCLPEDLSISKRFQIKEEPSDDMENDPDSSYRPKEGMSDSEGGMWSCEKCGKIFTVHKHLERHQELLCSVKPFICHVCNKAFRTNFRLWSHFQSHMSQGEESSFKEPEASAPVSSPSPPPVPPPPPPLPKIQPIEPESSTTFPEKRNTPEKRFSPQESDSLFYHAPPLSALTFKRQFMCKLCHRTFKTAFSLWSHEQTHN